MALSTIRGPNHISLLDDIAFYWVEVATKDEIYSAITNPYNSTLFLRNIIASIWMNTNEYIQAILSELETKLWEIEQMISPKLSDTEKDLYLRDFTIALNEVNTMRPRLNWFLAEMKVNCESLGTSPDTLPDGSKQNGNFVAIYNRLVTFQNWAEKLMNVITTLANLMETEKSLADSKSLARLTVLGFFFIPLSFIATIFSMGGDFLAGQSKFWVYFVVSVPLTLLVFVVAFGKWRVWWNEIRCLAAQQQ
jgi:Mg2+ and Co2+ transporter CorA